MGTPTGNEMVIVLALGLASMLVSMMQTLVVPILGLIQSSLHTSAAGAGHFFQLDRPDAVTELILGHARAHRTAGTA
ncbi:hypothetical protein [Streptomyces sp. NPDC048277]|uniref:hypothetical protein n=1 Tax=Streptomyces sp. NPDC048277 TaxID=3155027 RepID=UPI0033CA9DD4